MAPAQTPSHPSRPASHTPGEWLTYPQGSMTCVYTRDNQARDVFIAKEVGHLDARLIAAAPRMLAALQEAERFLDYLANDRTLFVGPGTPKTALKQVQAAITKAMGASGAAGDQATPPEQS